MKYKHIYYLSIALIIVLFSSILTESKIKNELNIYSGRKLELINPLINKFENESKIKINIVTGKSDAFIERLKLEGTNSPADILLTTDVTRLIRAKKNNLFISINSDILL